MVIQTFLEQTNQKQKKTEKELAINEPKLQKCKKKEFPDGIVDKNLLDNTGDESSILDSGRSHIPQSN